MPNIRLQETGDAETGASFRLGVQAGNGLQIHQGWRLPSRDHGQGLAFRPSVVRSFSLARARVRVRVTYVIISNTVNSLFLRKEISTEKRRFFRCSFLPLPSWFFAVRGCSVLRGCLCFVFAVVRRLCDRGGVAQVAKQGGGRLRFPFLLAFSVLGDCAGRDAFSCQVLRGPD